MSSQSVISAEAVHSGRGKGKEIALDKIVAGIVAIATGTPDLVVNVSAGVLYRTLKAPTSFRRPSVIGDGGGYGLGRTNVDVAPGTVTVVPGGAGTALLASVFVDTTSGALSIVHSDTVTAALPAQVATLKHPATPAGKLRVCDIGTQAAPVLAATTAITDAMINNAVRNV